MYIVMDDEVSRAVAGIIYVSMPAVREEGLLDIFLLFIYFYFNQTIIDICL
jgi:hypothetical protein